MNSATDTDHAAATQAAADNAIQRVLVLEMVRVTEAAAIAAAQLIGAMKRRLTRRPWRRCARPSTTSTSMAPW
jgi:hypothetical protein